MITKNNKEVSKKDGERERGEEKPKGNAYTTIQTTIFRYSDTSEEK